MKPVLSYLLSSLFILAGCTNEIEKELYVNEAPIRVAANRLEGSSTKTSITNFSPQDISHIGIVKAVNGQLISSTPVSPTSINGNILSFTPPLTYPADGSNVALCGYYPLQSMDKKPFTISDNILSFSLTGQEDMMWAVGPAGSKTDKQAASLSFTHKLAKISFALINETNIDTPPLGTISIIARGASSGTMNLLDGTISAESNIGHMALATDLTLTDLSTSETAVSGELFILPGSNYSFYLLIANDKEYPITFSTNQYWSAGVASTAYHLTITIKALSTMNNTMPEEESPGELAATKAFGISPSGHSVNASITVKEEQHVE